MNYDISARIWRLPAGAEVILEELDGGRFYAFASGATRASRSEADEDRHALATALLMGDAPAPSALLATLDRLGVPEGRLSVRLSWLAEALQPGGVLREQLHGELVGERDRALADIAETQARAAAREAELLARIEELEGMADTLAAAEEDATRRPSLRQVLRRLVFPARVR